MSVDNDDFIRYGTLGGKLSGSPTIISQLFVEYLQGMHAERQAEQFLLDVRCEVDCFCKWAYRHADGSITLLAEVDAYVDGVYSWVKGGIAKGSLDGLERHRLATRKQSLTEKLNDHVPERLAQGGRAAIDELLNRIESECYLDDCTSYRVSFKWVDREIERLSLLSEKMKLASKLIDKVFPECRDKHLYRNVLFDFTGEIAGYVGVLGNSRTSHDWTVIDTSINSAREAFANYLSRFRELRQGEKVPKSDPGTGDDCILKHTGQIWTVTFKGKVGSFLELQGWRLVAELLQHPGRDYSANELREILDAARSAERKAETEWVEDSSGYSKYSSRQEVMDPEYLRNIKEGRKKLRAVLDDDSASPAEKLEASETLEQLNSITSKATNIRGQSRSLGKTPANSLLKLYKKVLEATKKEHPDFRAHLKAFVKVGENCSYRPDSETKWRIS